MGTSKKRYKVAKEIKDEILKKIKEQGAPVASLAEQYGVSGATIYGWLFKGAKGQPTWSEYNKLKRENEQLKMVIGDLTVKLSVAQKKS